MEETLKPSFPPNYKYFEQGEGISSEESAALILKYIHDAFKGLYETVCILSVELILLELFEQRLKNFYLKITEVQDKLGTKIKHIKAKFDVPSLWSAVGCFVDILSAIDSQIMSPLFQSIK